MPRWLPVLLLGLLLPGCIHSRLNNQALHPSSTFEMIPEDRGLDYETFFVPVDGADLHAWFFPVAGARDTIVLCGGNTGNKSLFLPLAEELVERGYPVVLFDYRGFGFSSGEPDLWSLINDARRVVTAVRQRPDTDRIALMGVSLGSVVALGTAAAQPDDVDVVVIEAVVNSKAKLEDMVGGFLATVGGAFVVPDDWYAGDHAESLPQPVLFIHASEDGITSVSDAVPIFLRAGKSAAPRAFWVADGAGHAPGIAGAYGFELPVLVRRWLDRWLAPPGDASWFESAWEQRDGAVIVRVRPDGPEPRGRTPVEICVLPLEGDAGFAHVWFTPGGTNTFRVPFDGEPAFVIASSPAVGVVPNGRGWKRSDPYQESRRTWETLETVIYESLGYGMLLRLFGRRIFIRMGDALEGEDLLAACEQVEGWLDRLPDTPHPYVAPLYAETWDALAKRYVELGRSRQAVAAWDRSLALVPAHPNSHYWYGDANWELGWNLFAIASTLRKMAELTEDEAAKSEYLRRADAWQERANARSRRVKEWTASQRSASTTVAE